ncbi:MAG: SiaB family protein kinase [Bacteroidota bacterium]
MNPELSYRFFKKLENDQFSLIYVGEPNDQMTAALMRINETAVEEPKALRKTVSFLLVECFQNIIRHADKPEIINRTNNKPKMISLRNVGNAFYVASTNLIDNTKKEGLVSKLRSINTLTREELKAAYLEALDHNEISEKGGAGLGLIEMARRSGFPIEFDFDFVNYFFSAFHSQFRVVSDEGEANYTININNTKALYNDMVSENILMIRKGDFSQQSILPLFTMIEDSLSTDKNLQGVRKKILYLLIEMLQNISKHAAKRNGMCEGIIIIAVKNNHYIINTGNYIENIYIESLKAKLEGLVGMDQEQLSEMYKKKLFNEQIPGDNAGIGLIEISKYSTEKLRYDVKPVDDTLSFLSLSITI